MWTCKRNPSFTVYQNCVTTPSQFEFSFWLNFWGLIRVILCWANLTKIIRFFLYSKNIENGKIIRFDFWSLIRILHVYNNVVKSIHCLSLKDVQPDLFW